MRSLFSTLPAFACVARSLGPSQQLRMTTVDCDERCDAVSSPATNVVSLGAKQLEEKGVTRLDRDTATSRHRGYAAGDGRSPISCVFPPDVLVACASQSLCALRLRVPQHRVKHSLISRHRSGPHSRRWTASNRRTMTRQQPPTTPMTANCQLVFAGIGSERLLTDAKEDLRLMLALRFFCSRLLSLLGCLACSVSHEVHDVVEERVAHCLSARRA